MTQKIIVPTNETQRLTIKILETGGMLPYYTGDYVVTPNVDGLILETANKSMSDNVQVNPIPKHVTENEYGITISIG